MRANDLVWYNTLYLRLRANESKIIEIYIDTIIYKKTGYRFHVFSTIITANIYPATERVAQSHTPIPVIEIVEG